MNNSILKPQTHVDVTKDDPIWQKDTPPLKYPPLRFLSREYGSAKQNTQTNIPSKLLQTSASRSLSDDGSDFSFSSADTIILASSNGVTSANTRSPVHRPEMIPVGQDHPTHLSSGTMSERSLSRRERWKSNRQDAEDYHNEDCDERGHQCYTYNVFSGTLTPGNPEMSENAVDYYDQQIECENRLNYDEQDQSISHNEENYTREHYSLFGALGDSESSQLYIVSKEAEPSARVTTTNNRLRQRPDTDWAKADDISPERTNLASTHATRLNSSEPDIQEQRLSDYNTSAYTVRPSIAMIEQINSGTTYLETNLDDEYIHPHWTNTNISGVHTNTWTLRDKQQDTVPALEGSECQTNHYSSWNDESVCLQPLREKLYSVSGEFVGYRETTHPQQQGSLQADEFTGNGYQQRSEQCITGNLNESPDVTNMDMNQSYLSSVTHREDIYSQGHQGFTNGTLPEVTVNKQTGMRGMLFTQGDGGMLGPALTSDEQITMKDTHHFNRAMEPDEGIGEERILPLYDGEGPLHPQISQLQIGNEHSDTSSVDSDGVPYRKSVLKTTTKTENSKRTGRKVRFAEPLVEDENKPIAMSARERLGLKDNSQLFGASILNRPLLGQQSDNIDDNTEKTGKSNDLGYRLLKAIINEDDPSSDQLPNGVISQNGHLENEDKNSYGENGLYIPRQESSKINMRNKGYEKVDRNIYDGDERDYIYKPRIQQNNSPTSHYNSDESSRHIADSEKSDSSPESMNNKPRAKIVRRPAISISRKSSPGLSPNAVIRKGPGDSPASRSMQASDYGSANQIPNGHVDNIQDRLSPRDDTRIGSQGSLLRIKSPADTRDNTTTHHGDTRYGRYYSDGNSPKMLSPSQVPDGYRTVENSYPEENNPSASDKTPLYLKIGQKVLPTLDKSRVSQLSQSSSEPNLSHERRTSDRYPVPNRTNMTGYRPSLSSHNAASNQGFSQSPYGHSQSVLPPPSHDLAVLANNSDTSSVPSPMSGDSGISSSSSYNDISRDQMHANPDNIGDNYNTLNYIKKNKTKNILDRVGELRQSYRPEDKRHGSGPPYRITGPPNQMPAFQSTPQANVVRRVSSRSQERREIRSAVESDGGTSPMDQWARVIDNQTHDDSQIGYGSRSSVAASDISVPASDMPYSRPPWERDPRMVSHPRNHPANHHGHHQSPQHVQHGNFLRTPDTSGYVSSPDQSYNRNHDYYKDDPNPYEVFQRSATNRSKSTKNLVAIPLDILSPRAPEQTRLTNGSNYENQTETSSQHSNSSGYDSQQGYHNGYNPAHRGENTSPYGHHQQQTQNYQQHPRNLAQEFKTTPPNRHMGNHYSHSPSQEPVYSSTADIYKLLQMKTRNPFVKSGDFT